MAGDGGVFVRVGVGTEPVEGRGETIVEQSHPTRDPRRRYCTAARRVNRPDGRAFAALAAEAGMSGVARAVYRVLDDHADRYHRAVVTVARLALLSGFGTTGVRSALRELEGAGFIEAAPQTGKPTAYWFTATPTHSVGANGCTPTENPNDPNAKPQQPQRPALPSELFELSEAQRGTFLPGTGWVRERRRS